MANEPFFRKEGDLFLPTRAGIGPWTADSLHGRLIIGLLGAEIERQYRTPEYMPARLTVDMYRLPDLSPVEVVTRVVKDGYRIKVVDAEFISGGQSAGRATCQLLRRTGNALGKVWAPDNWDAPKPADMPPPEQRPMGGMWDMRRIAGDFGVPGHPRRVWMAEVRDLVEGEPFTPFARVATAADFVSPFANSGDQGLGYINSDVTIYLHREPVTDWVGFDVTGHGATDGVAIGECRLYDEQGVIGAASCTALAQKRKVS
ncbi:thioesterase family protein [Phenylobacterium sp.]|uniref:thioesterase family protein n=1 Tax=Phenylobacterium sp. TaxID=1871053 RepID=UPI0025FDF3CF|nr:thioesterase family protein [Phenylobacterium sp.]MBX3485401.1 thioesterase family protein [Phenylobacterium sp.]MCW5758390.1 thioesterase family protein [Phenylobacterium sp.]